MGLDAFIAGIGTCLPGDPVDNALLAEALRLDRDWIDTFIGTATRHFARDTATGEVRWTLAELCAQAAERALEDAGLDPLDVEFVVLATATPDALIPATVNEVADLLGVDQVPTYQLQSGCAGAVQALDLARGFVESGRHRAGLVLGGDVSTKHLDLSSWASPQVGTDQSRADQSRADRSHAARSRAGSAGPGELVNLVLFGDGAGAAVVADRPGVDRPGLVLRHTINRLTGTGRAAGQRVAWFGAAEREPGDGDGRPAFHEDYKAVEQLVPAMAAEVLWELLDDLGWDHRRLDYLLPPQLSGRMTRRIVEELGVDGATEVSCVAETGNTGNALPLLQLERLAAVIRPGQRALAVAIESSKWIKTGLALECARPDGSGAHA